MQGSRFTIGWLSAETGCKVQTIRYYEEIGVMPEPGRSQGNQRLYEPWHATRLAFIRHGRELGFSLDALRGLLGLSDDLNQPCQAADRIARVHLRDVERRITSLRALKGELERMVEQCRGGKISDCRVIEVLAEHAQCLAGDHGVPPPGRR
jgi:DNA-binding transcriptional MerR regulator